MQGSELLRLVDAIHRERNVEKEVLFQALEHALLTAVRKKYGEGASVAVTISRDTGETRVVGPTGQIDMAELGRIAAQTAKQVFGQILREAEREVIFSEYDRFQRALVTGTVYRLDGTAVIVNLGKTEGYLPKHEQVRGETYRVGDRILCYVVEVKKIGNRVKIILSRSHPDMIRRLFEREIPEIADGVVEIVQLVREAGYKTKVACSSLDPKVDPIGACVGVRGTRIRNIIEELNGEKIDIIRHNESPEVLIVNALKPAQINSITLYEDMKRALVVVDEDQLSLAIGKKGANVRLASKLSYWDIDIMSEAEARERGVFDVPATAEAVEVKETGEIVATPTEDESAQKADEAPTDTAPDAAPDESAPSTPESESAPAPSTPESAPAAVEAEGESSEPAESPAEATAQETPSEEAAETPQEESAAAPEEGQNEELPPAGGAPSTEDPPVAAAPAVAEESPEGAAGGSGA